MIKTGKTKLLAAPHTGKLRPHHHTSYLSLLMVLLLAVIPVLVAGRSVAYAATSGGGDYQTYAVVPGAVPKTAPTITNIASGRNFTTSDPVPVRGSCPSGTLVKIFKNEVFAGAALCQNGTYQLDIDLFVGQNTLVARAYNANDAVSPDSAPVSVQLVLPGSSIAGSGQLNTLGAPANQFYITSEVFHRGAATDTVVSWPITIAGGQAPYALSVSWGDGKSDLFSQGTAGLVTVSHSYTKDSLSGAGYTIVLKATDQQGSKSYLQFVALIHSGAAAPSVAGSIKSGYDHSLFIRLAWQALAVLILVVLSFWLGEKRELWLVRQKANRAV